MSTRRRTPLRIAEYVFLTAGLLALGCCVFAWVSAELFQQRKANQFSRQLHQTTEKAPAAPVAAPPAVLPDGEVIGKLQIPRLGMSVMIVQGDGSRDLRRALGHIPGTALPWQSGNVGIAGHRDTFFRPLRLIRPNDTITLSTLDGAYRYRVISTRVVPPGDVRVLYPTKSDTLTLVTCFPFYYVGSAPKRFIVRARRDA